MFALFEVQQLCLVPLSCVWTVLIYPQTGEQVNPAQQRQAWTAFSFEGFSQWRMSVSSGQSREITLTWCIVRRLRVWGGGILNLSKSCRLWGVSNVYAAWGGKCFQWIYCICPALLLGPCHTHPGCWKCGWASSHESSECIVDGFGQTEIIHQLPKIISFYWT